jgi:branched-chain amino acid transport system permease protein
LGRIWRGIREDEGLVKMLGKNAVRAKLLACVVSAALASVGGILYAHYSSYIEPSGFGLNESILVLSMVMVGGAGSVWGPVGGAALLVGFPEVMRFVGFPETMASHLRQVLYGLVLIGSVILKPRGLGGRYDFGRV